MVSWRFWFFFSNVATLVIIITIITIIITMFCMFFILRIASKSANQPECFVSIQPSKVKQLRNVAQVDHLQWAVYIIFPTISILILINLSLVRFNLLQRLPTCRTVMLCWPIVILAVNLIMLRLIPTRPLYPHNCSYMLTCTMGNSCSTTTNTST
jgi:hypothetical protein